MSNIKIAFWGGLILLTVLWAMADPAALHPAGFFPLREAMLQSTGVLSTACMSLAMILALRPKWPEQWLGGLDKMYRLHKWLGIGGGLVLGIVHWLWSEGPKWATGLGLLARPVRGARPVIDNALQQFFLSQRGWAESTGEWAFYATTLLIVVALVHMIPYRLFYKTHRLIAIAYLVLVYHSVVLTQFSYWTTPLGFLMAVLQALGTVAAVVVLFRRVGAGRKVEGKLTNVYYYESLRVIEGQIDIPHDWRGHKAGQFAFVTSNPSEGPHPYTIASAWNPSEHKLTFITKELGDHTSTLRDSLQVGQSVVVEGPYGCFTFEDDAPRQIWVGGGIGITPFVARMKQLARGQQVDPGAWEAKDIYLFHTTADYDEEAISKLKADAVAAGVHLQVLHDARDGRLTGDRIRAAVPGWHEASIWFCGPVRFGEALRRDFADRGLKVGRRFHQEVFALR